MSGLIKGYSYVYNVGQYGPRRYAVIDFTALESLKGNAPSEISFVWNHLDFGDQLG
ncbi:MULTISPECIES: hypothetical protein [Rhodobacterales]|uniref:hypothetical protein n=1 Tax=Rhodobacterales TaxID=204455 RepID=UPI0015F0E928|nr:MULTISPECIES: hypothetical protein [Rhodobacterales]MDO6588776.1 hypothetical protein [Yoonia sp. 1_MG-2023]